MGGAETKATLFAILAAVLYALNMPAAKVLLQEVQPMMMAGLLYLGAGLGIGVLYLLGRKLSKQDFGGGKPLTKREIPFVLGMILLDMLAPILLMVGLQRTRAANASLLNNFEIVATSLLALLVFKEQISAKLWQAIPLVTLASVMLSFEGGGSLEFSWGSLLVLAAAAAWGLENNCTRMLAGNNTYVIVVMKGIFSGLGSFIVAVLGGEVLPKPQFIALVLGLGFIAYGLSIFFYIRAQHVLGAAKTSAWYAIAPFVGAFLSFVFLRETLSGTYLLALVIMMAGSWLVVKDTKV